MHSLRPLLDACFRFILRPLLDVVFSLVLLVMISCLLPITILTYGFRKLGEISPKKTRILAPRMNWLIGKAEGAINVLHRGSWKLKAVTAKQAAKDPTNNKEELYIFGVMSSLQKVAKTKLHLLNLEQDVERNPPRKRYQLICTMLSMIIRIPAIIFLNTFALSLNIIKHTVMGTLPRFILSSILSFQITYYQSRAETISQLQAQHRVVIQDSIQGIPWHVEIDNKIYLDTGVLLRAGLSIHTISEKINKVITSNPKLKCLVGHSLGGYLLARATPDTNQSEHQKVGLFNAPKTLHQVIKGHFGSCSAFMFRVLYRIVYFRSESNVDNKAECQIYSNPLDFVIPPGARMEHNVHGYEQRSKGNGCDNHREIYSELLNFKANCQIEVTSSGERRKESEEAISAGWDDDLDTEYNPP